jgi:hypothetical protein
MRKVHIYVGREAIDYDCIVVNFIINGVKYSYEVRKDGTFGGKDQFTYTDIDFDISIKYYTTEWRIEIYDYATDEPHIYYNTQDTDFPNYKRWLYKTGIENYEIDFVGTDYCYIQVYDRLELFNDEKISVTLTTQNIQDISKTFTDFSQSFTVPASVVNNQIFEHFYQNDIDGTIDPNLRRPAYIELDFMPFRKGVISLEKANIKNGKVDNYSISFYGQLVSLKDIFGEDKLNQLDLSSLEFTFNGTNIYNRITDLATDYNVRYPLIASNRLWTYNDSGSQDITQNAHAIAYNELFPAVKVARLMDAIETRYGISIASDFFSDERYTELFLLAKNATEYTFLTETKDADFISEASSITGLNPYDPGDYVNILENSITFRELNDANRHTIQMQVATISGTGTYYIEAYCNGIYEQTFENTGTGYPLKIQIANFTGADRVYTFNIKANAPMTMTVVFTYSIRTTIDDPITGNPVTNTNTSVIQCNSVVLSGNVDITNTLPDMKVSDFFSGILKQFNMTCVGIDQNSFEILPLDLWYSNGITYDITNYVDIESVDVSKMPIYKKISFQYEQSESFINRNYFSISNSEYGNTDNVYNYDGGEFMVQLPFENLQFARAEDNDSPVHYAILGYHLNKDYQAYIPKPTLLYLYGTSGTLDHNIKFYNGTTHVNISSYGLFGQDLTVGGIKYSLNWGADNSVIHAETIQDGLFATYYFNYLSNLYNLKQRLVSIKAQLPVKLVTYLKLNDRLIIRDKRYIINDLKKELHTGEAQITMYSDFTPIAE